MIVVCRVLPYQERRGRVEIASGREGRNDERWKWAFISNVATAKLTFTVIARDSAFDVNRYSITFTF